nr:ARID DNA-binding domain-containing protein [Tanacetum cinerariifolium]
MVNTNSFLESKWHERTNHKGHGQQWYQSKNHGRPPRKTSQFELLQRQIKREKEDGIERCVRKITKDCKNMLKKKIKEIAVYNSLMSQDKYNTSNTIAFIVTKRSMLLRREVLIMNGNKDYLIPGVHYAPEATLNILFINQLKQQGFKIIYKGNRCTLEYMFKNQHGRNLDVDKIRQRHNDYLDDYFESLDKERTDKKGEEPRIMENTDTSEFGQEFDALAEILGLTRSDGEEIRKFYMTYLKVFIFYYKTARAPKDPMRGGEDLKSLEEYQWNFGKRGASFAVEKRKERLEHFGIKLEEEEDCKQQ